MNAERLRAPGRRPKIRGWIFRRLWMLPAILATLACAGCATVSRADYARDAAGLDVLADIDVSGWPVQVGVLDEAGAVTVCATSPGKAPVCVRAAKRGP